MTLPPNKMLRYLKILNKIYTHLRTCGIFYWNPSSSVGVEIHVRRAAWHYRLGERSWQHMRWDASGGPGWRWRWWVKQQGGSSFFENKMLFLWKQQQQEEQEQEQEQEQQQQGVWLVGTKQWGWPYQLWSCISGWNILMSHDLTLKASLVHLLWSNYSDLNDLGPRMVV